MDEKGVVYAVEANTEVKTAIVKHVRKCIHHCATRLLEKHEGFLRPILEFGEKVH